MTPEVPTQPVVLSDVQPIIDQIDDILDANGKVPQATKDALLFSVTKSILMQTARIEVDVKHLGMIEQRVVILEKRNIITWMIDHPGVSIFFITLLMLLLFQHFGSAILIYFGVKVPLILSP